MLGHRDKRRGFVVGIGTAFTAGILMLFLGWSAGAAGAATEAAPACATPTAPPTITAGSATASPSPSPSPTPLPPTATPATSGFNGPLYSGGQVTTTATASPTPLPVCTPVPATATVAPGAAVTSLPTARATVGPGAASAGSAVTAQSPVGATPAVPTAASGVSATTPPPVRAAAVPVSGSTSSSSSAPSEQPPPAALGLPPSPPPGYVPPSNIAPPGADRAARIPVGVWDAGHQGHSREYRSGRRATAVRPFPPASAPSAAQSGFPPGVARPCRRCLRSRPSSPARAIPYWVKPRRSASSLASSRCLSASGCGVARRSCGRPPSAARLHVGPDALYCVSSVRAARESWEGNSER